MHSCGRMPEHMRPNLVKNLQSQFPYDLVDAKGRGEGFPEARQETLYMRLVDGMDSHLIGPNT